MYKKGDFYIENKLIPPCTYQGGKQRVAKEIVDYIADTTMIYSNTKFFDLCCGSGTISIELINRGFNPENIVMCDASSWGKFWKSIGDGKFDLNIFKGYINQIPEDRFKIQNHIKELSKQDANIDEEYKYILIQAAAFGGISIWKENNEWKNARFRNYWQPTETSNRKSPVNPMQPMPDSIFERVEKLHNKCKGIKVFHTDIFEVLSHIPNENCVIYIDPPYNKKYKYGFSFELQDFISKVFDVTLSPVFVSEKESISDESIRLSFKGEKGGINGNKTNINEEWLNIYR